MYLYLDNERVVMGELIVDVISFQKIFGFCGLKGHIVEIWRDVTLVDNERRTTECEDRARILGTRIRNCGGFEPLYSSPTSPS